MNREEANLKAKKIFDNWQKKKEEIEKDAKEKGIWENTGLDANSYLFKSIDAEAKEQLQKISSQIK